MFSRRNFLKLGGLAAAGGLVLGSNADVFGQSADTGPYFPIPVNAYSDTVNSFSQRTFEPLLDTSFLFARKDAPAVSLRLVEIVGGERKRSVLENRANDSFLLIFETAGKDVLDDGIYTASHPELGEFSIFVSTFGRSGKRYQATFSRVYF